MRMSHTNPAWLAAAAGLCLTPALFAQSQTDDDVYRPQQRPQQQQRQAQQRQQQRQSDYSSTYDQYGNRRTQYDAFGNPIYPGDSQFGRQQGRDPYNQQYGQQRPMDTTDRSVRDNRFDPYGQQRSTYGTPQQRRTTQQQYDRPGQQRTQYDLDRPMRDDRFDPYGQQRRTEDQYPYDRSDPVHRDEGMTGRRYDREPSTDMQPQDRWPGAQDRFPGQGNAYGVRPEGQDQWSGEHDRYMQRQYPDQYQDQQSWQREQDAQMRPRSQGQQDSRSDQSWQNQNQQNRQSQQSWQTQQRSQSDWRNGQQPSWQGQQNRQQTQTWDTLRNREMDRSRDMSQQQTWQSRQSTTQQMQATATQLSGSVDRVTVRTIQGQDHLLALVTTDNGYQWVDLGDAESAQSFRQHISRGGQLTFSGSATDMGGQQVYVARSISVNGQTIPISGTSAVTTREFYGTTQPQQESWRQTRTVESGSQLQGTVQTITTTTIQGEPQMVVVLDTDRGPQRIALGPVNEVRQYVEQIQEGRPLSLTIVKGDDDTVFARSLVIDGRTVTLPAVQQQTFTTREFSQPQSWRSSAGRVEGVIHSVTTTTIQNEPHLVVWLDTERGFQQVDLGPASEVEHLRAQFQEGQTLLVTARPGPEQDVLIAQTVMLDGRTIPLGGRSFEERTFEQRSFTSTPEPQVQTWQTQTHQNTSPMTIAGTVDTMLVRNLNGERHLLTLIDGEGGFHWVDLGPLESVRHLRGQINEGQRIELTASPSEISGQSVYVAETVSVNGQMIPLTTTMTQTRRFSTNEPAQRFQSREQRNWTNQRSTTFAPLSGTVQTVTTTTIQGEPFLVAKVRTDQGLRQVNLGPAAQARSFQSLIREGQQITFQGSPQTLNNQTYYTAQSFTVDGRTIRTGNQPDDGAQDDTQDQNMSGDQQNPPYGRARGYRDNRGMDPLTGQPGRRRGQQNAEPPDQDENISGPTTKKPKDPKGPKDPNEPDDDEPQF
jgi:hypothetical protein